MREIYSHYLDRVESFGLDECWIDVTDSTGIRGDGLAVANEINWKIRTELGITVSVGVTLLRYLYVTRT